ncbi:MAG: hypothetical protein NT069_21925 [Planctomycetota bacterium]|nr:hypothetical protein [Planctomycetota bacterium]
MSDSGPTQHVPPAPDDESKSILRKPLRAFSERHVSLPPAGEIDFAPRMITCYKPLYFEDANLERYGYSRGGCLQPIVSGVHFFGSVGLAPLKMLGAGPCQPVCPFPDAEEGYRLRPARNLFGPTPRYDRVFGHASGSAE